MKSLNHSIGAYGESLASDYLRDCGYYIIEENFSCKIGEIDIIARDGPYLCFIEVKSRYSLKYGAPRESITPHKQKKIRQVAEYYLMINHTSDVPLRFDIMETYFKDNSYHINLIKNAF